MLRLDNTYIKEKIILVLRSIYDPEILVSIWNLGLIYQIRLHHEYTTTITMALTSPICPMASSIIKNIQCKILRCMNIIVNVKVMIVWHPKWTQSLMDKKTKFILDIK